MLFRALVQCQNDCIVMKQASVQRQTFTNKENSRDQGYTSDPVKNRLPCTAICKICLKSAKRKWSPVLKMSTIDLLFFAPSPKWLGLAHFHTYPALPHKFKSNPHPAPPNSKLLLFKRWPLVVAQKNIHFDIISCSWGLAASFSASSPSSSTFLMLCLL